MQPIAGELTFREVLGVNPLIGRRLFWRAQRPWVLATTGFILACATAAAFYLVAGGRTARTALTPGLFLLATAIAAAACAILLLGVRRSIGRVIRERGIPESYVVFYHPEAEQLTITTERMTTQVRWSAVSEIAPAPMGWLLMIDLFGFLLPRRLFETPEQERAFLAEVLSRIGPEARARSREAAEHVGAA